MWHKGVLSCIKVHCIGYMYIMYVSVGLQLKCTQTADPKSDNTGHKAEAIGDTDKQHSTANELSTALLAQQLPPLPKYNGSSDSSEEIFQERIAQFELWGEVCKWNPRAQQLIHLTT